MLSKKMKLMMGVALFGFCASISPSQAHHPGKVRVIYPVHSHAVVVVHKPHYAVTHKKVVVVKKNRRNPIKRAIHAAVWH